MIKQQFLVFCLRWVLTSGGMWVCINLFGEVTGENNLWLYLLAGFIFSLVNSFVKPLAVILALPLIIVTVGIFTLVVNVLMVMLAIHITPGVTMHLPGLIFTTLIMSLINSLANFLVPEYNKE